MVYANAAGSMVDQYTRLSNPGSYALLLLRHDYFRAALLICQNTYVSASLQSNAPFPFLINISLFADSMSSEQMIYGARQRGYPHLVQVHCICYERVGD